MVSWALYAHATGAAPIPNASTRDAQILLGAVHATTDSLCITVSLFLGAVVSKPFCCVRDMDFQAFVVGLEPLRLTGIYFIPRCSSGNLCLHSAWPVSDGELN